jgi:hypothetical protein
MMQNERENWKLETWSEKSEEHIDDERKTHCTATYCTSYLERVSSDERVSKLS